jgi:hypothetical protein
MILMKKLKIMKKEPLLTLKVILLSMMESIQFHFGKMKLKVKMGNYKNIILELNKEMILNS